MLIEYLSDFLSCLWEFAGEAIWIQDCKRLPVSRKKHKRLINAVIMLNILEISIRLETKENKRLFINKTLKNFNYIYLHCPFPTQPLPR